MEVHHHSHSARKKWTHYFWEFLMLFLAVFCGFLAEYQLEHKIEKDRAKQFAVSLHQDLVKDTLEFNQVLSNLSLCAENTDSLIRLLGRPSSYTTQTAEIYRLSVYAFIFPVSDANESTLQQLLNSGSLRYFRNDSLVARIKEYNLRVQRMKDFSAASIQFNTDFRKAQATILEVNPLLVFIRTRDFLNKENYVVSDSNGFFKGYPLLTTEAVKIKEYANWCALKKFYMENTRAYLARLKNTAVPLLQLLDKKIH